MDRDIAIKATKNGAIAASISAVLTLVMMSFALLTNAEGTLSLWNDPLTIIDVIIIAGCAFGIYKKSRTAAMLLFVYFLAAKIIIAVELENYSSLAVAFIFLYFYGKAIQGAFAFHKIEKAENPNYTPTSKWWLLLSVPSSLILVILVISSVMTTTGVLPSTKVLSYKEISQSDIHSLQESGVITQSDRVSHFYSHGITSVLESGNLLTQDRVILYFLDENDDLQVYELYYTEITDVALEEKGSSMSDSVYLVSTDTPNRWLKLFLSTENKGNQRFIEALNRHINANGI